jgi:hypothetical protein
MNIQRLKFAQARGARIQWHNPTTYRVGTDIQWHAAMPNHFLPHYRHLDLRIHPEDAHLEYGPISKGLIDWALYSYDTQDHPEIDAAEAYFNWRLIIEGVPDPRFVCPGFAPFSVEDWGMFKLFMAELLADEGL